MITLGKDMAKAQYAVPVIIIALIVAMLWYLIMVYPEERTRLLFGNITDEENGTSPITALYSISNVGEIRAPSGVKVMEFGPFSFDVAYPAKESVVESADNFLLASNIILPGSKTFYVNDVNLNDTQGLTLKFMVSSIVGASKISVAVNNKQIYSAQASAGPVSIQIPSNQLLENNKIDVQNFFTGLLFWETQSISIANLTLSKAIYSADKPLASQMFMLDSPINRGNVNVKFFAFSATNAGNLNIKINNYTAYSGKPEKGNWYTASAKLSDLGLTLAENDIGVSVDKGGVYSINSLAVGIYTENLAPKSYVTDTFSIPGGIVGTNRVQIRFNITNVYIPGEITFLLSTNVTKFKTITADSEGRQITLALLPSDLSPTMGMTIKSPNGDFNIQDLDVIYR